MHRMIHVVVDLNNRGVSYLEAGDHEMARISFKEALERTTYLLNLKQEAEERFGREGLIAQYGLPPQRHQQSSVSSSSSSCSISLSSSSTSCRNNGLAERMASSCSLTESMQVEEPAIRRVPISTSLTSRDTGCFIYSHALLLTGPVCDIPTAEEYCHRESAVIMFNLALVHHWRGMHFGVTSLLPKALKLYEMSFSLLQNGATFETHHLILALLNNMGQIHHELTNYREAEECFRNLKQLLAQGNGRVEGPEVQGFLMNIMFLEAPGMAPAA